MVQNNVRNDSDPVFFQSLAGVEKLFPAPVFRGNRTFLIELSEIEKVIWIVAGATAPARALVGGRKPRGGNSKIGEIFGLLCSVLPKERIAGYVPVKELDHRRVHRSAGRYRISFRL